MLSKELCRRIDYSIYDDDREIKRGGWRRSRGDLIHHQSHASAEDRTKRPFVASGQEVRVHSAGADVTKDRTFRLSFELSG